VEAADSTIAGFFSPFFVFDRAMNFERRTLLSPESKVKPL
jgi:hypothetical protein